MEVPLVNPGAAGESQRPGPLPAGLYPLPSRLQPTDAANTNRHRDQGALSHCICAFVRLGTSGLQIMEWWSTPADPGSKDPGPVFLGEGRRWIRAGPPAAPRGKGKLFLGAQHADYQGLGFPGPGGPPPQKPTPGCPEPEPCQSSWLWGC